MNQTSKKNKRNDLFLVFSTHGKLTKKKDEKL
jgi:hypothetical protein